jgi:signal transduction histidine kinase
MKSTSLIRRTIFVVLIAELLCAMAFSGSALEHERHIRNRSFDVLLQGRSDSILGALQDAEDAADSVKIDPAELRIPPQDTYAVYNLNGALIGSSAGADSALIERQSAGFADRVSHGRRFRVYQRTATRLVDREDKGGVTVRNVTILYASSKEHIWHEILEAASFYMLVSLLCMAITAALLVLLLRRVLAPIQELAGAASSVTAHDPHFEPPPSALQVRELQPLAETLHAAISSLRHALEKEQRFVGDAAHELKTSVAVVRSTVQVLMMRPRSTKEHVDGLETLLSDNQRVEDLVARMLLLARMDDRHGAETATAGLDKVVKLLTPGLQNFAEAREITIVVPEADGTILALSEEKAEVLLSNLVMNAVQHSPRGSQVEVRLTVSGDVVGLAVEDHGAGISPDALPHIFERFFREDRSRSRETGGAGLGLAICKSIVDAAGGTIAVQSAEGQGTTVIVTLPRAPAR